MSTEDTVADGKVVSIHFTLKNNAGEVLDSSEGHDPLDYLHGADNVVPGLERELIGKSVGDELVVEVAAKDGYGVRQGEIFSVDRDSFPEDAELEKGTQFVAEADEGPIPLWVDRIEDGKVYVDPNHPLAGVQLNFDVTVVAIRAASEEEVEHGHPHGPGGHEH
jgi:FKBP-type peptidyl-prolyl cis-trans isomerase SlyD